MCMNRLELSPARCAFRNADGQRIESSGRKKTTACNDGPVGFRQHASHGAEVLFLLADRFFRNPFGRPRIDNKRGCQRICPLERFSGLEASRLDHPYGHGKIEFFSVGFEGALIVLRQEQFSGRRCQNHRTQAAAKTRFWASYPCRYRGGNLWLGKTLISTGKRTRSIGHYGRRQAYPDRRLHYGGRLIGLFLVRQTGWYFLDGAVACVVAANILFIGARLVFESSSRLMHAYDPELLDRIGTIIEQNRKPAWMDIHRLRAWRSGRTYYMTFISFCRAI